MIRHNTTSVDVDDDDDDDDDEDGGGGGGLLMLINHADDYVHGNGMVTTTVNGILYSNQMKLLPVFVSLDNMRRSCRLNGDGGGYQVWS